MGVNDGHSSQGSNDSSCRVRNILCRAPCPRLYGIEHIKSAPNTRRLSCFISEETEAQKGLDDPGKRSNGTQTQVSPTASLHAQPPCVPPPDPSICSGLRHVCHRFPQPPESQRTIMITVPISATRALKLGRPKATSQQRMKTWAQVRRPGRKALGPPLKSALRAFR